MAKKSTTTPASYFLQRMHELSLTKEDYTLTTPMFERGEKTEYTRTLTFFEPDDKGIRIHYYTAQGLPYTYDKKQEEDDSGTKWGKEYSRLRLQEPAELIDKEGVKSYAKYIQPKGSGVYPFLTPGVIKAWIDKQYLDTLIIVEGEFKAFKAWKELSLSEKISGVGFIGIPSIHGYDGDTEVARGIHPEILRVIDDCRVQNIIFLTDADTLTVKWAEGKDLSIRPTSFFNAVKYFREALQSRLDDKEMNLQQVYFMHLKTDLVEKEAKGLDDLLSKYSARSEDILYDLLKMHLARDWFVGLMITDAQFHKQLRKHFGLEGEKEFYALYKPYIGDKEFRYKTQMYFYDGKEVVYMRHKDAEKYMRVGADWLATVKIPNYENKPMEEIVKWKVGEIQRDYKRFPGFMEQIPKFDSFFSRPGWLPGTYKRVQHNCLNLMLPLTHDPSPGRFDHTIEFLKHLFQGKGMITWNEKMQQYEEQNSEGDPFTVALDYLTLQFCKPTQMLPVPILVSKEFETGKTSFLDWLSMIYGSNAVVLDNATFKMTFNSHYIGKFIIGLDEGFLDVDKKAEKERLKQLATSKEQQLQYKGVDNKKIAYFGKLIICSNDADNVMKIEEGENRWFIVKVPVLKKKDPDMMDKIKAEIPAWLDYISKRKVFHPKKTRIWFDDKLIMTEQYHKIIQMTRDYFDQVFEEWIKEQFLTYGDPVLRYAMKDILEIMNDPKTAKYKADQKKVLQYLEEKKKLRKIKGRYKFPVGFDRDMNSEYTDRVNYKHENGRYYEFKFEEWLNDKEKEEFAAATEKFRLANPVQEEEKLPF